jgi:TM2 domain-containing membrane protein YozV
MSTPVSDAVSNEKTCSSCGALIKKDAKMCTNCGAVQPGNDDKNHVYGRYPTSYEPKRKVIAILFLIFLGLLGGHRFYVGKIKTGILMPITLGLGFWVANDLSGIFSGNLWAGRIQVILMLLTLGGLFIWWIIDFFGIICGFLKDKNGYELK